MHSLVEHAVLPHRRTCPCNQPPPNNPAFWLPAQPLLSPYRGNLHSGFAVLSSSVEQLRHQARCARQSSTAGERVAHPRPLGRCRLRTDARRSTLRPRALGWQYAFPSAALRHWPPAQVTVRWHASPSTVQKAFKQALASSGIRKAAGVHALRHSFASRIYWPTADIRRIQSLLGHRSLQTTMIDPHILEIEGGHLAIGPAPHLTGCGSSASRTTLARKVLSPSVRSRGVSGYAPLTACGRFC